MTTGCASHFLANYWSSVGFPKTGHAVERFGESVLKTALGETSGQRREVSEWTGTRSLLIFGGACVLSHLQLRDQPKVLTKHLNFSSALL